MEIEFTRIFELYSQDIYRLIYSYTLNSTEAKDILQETFLKLYKHFKRLPKDDLQIKKWLIKVSSNQSKDFLKSFWHSNIKDLPNEYFNSPLSKNDEKIYKILKELNKKYRVPIYLYYYEGYEIDEIAEILNLSKSAVKMRISRAKEKIKNEMER